MGKLGERRVPGENRLLAVLPDGEYKQLLPNLEPVQLSYGEVLYESGERISHVYFPGSALISLLALTADGETMELGAIGSEGVAGVVLFLEADTAPYQTVVRVPGTAVRLKAEVFARECVRQPVLGRLLRRYAYLRLREVSQLAVCSRFHPVLERLCRWLLLVRDRAQVDEVPLTQELLARTLGVRRASVGEAINELQEAGLIQHTRGQVAILDRPGLEARVCECYSVVKAEFDQWLRA